MSDYQVKKNKTHLLVDADVLLYKLSNASMISQSWPDGLETKAARLPLAKNLVRAYLDGWRAQFNTQHLTLYISPLGSTFRKEIEPSYKMNRKVEKPVGFNALRDYLLTFPNVVCREGVEADDALAQDATRSYDDGLTRIILSADKDLLGVPALVYHSGSRRIFHATPDQALSFSLAQALVGDTVDGYPGVRGYGKVKVLALLEKFCGTRGFEHFIRENKLDYDHVCHQWRLSKMLWSSNLEYPSVALYKHCPELWASSMVIQPYMPYFFASHTTRYGMALVK